MVFVRGHAPNRDGWVANPSSNPDGAERAIWAARTAAPGVAWRVAEGAAPELSPDGSVVLYVKDGQIYRARVTARPGRRAAIDRGEEPFIKAGARTARRAGRRTARRSRSSASATDHSFIGIYDVATRTLKYMAPERGPRHEPDLVAGQQAHRVHPPAGLAVRSAGAAGRRRNLAMPNGPAFNPAQQAGRGGQGRGGGAEAAAAAADAAAGAKAPAASAIAPVPGLDARDVPRRLHAVAVGRPTRRPARPRSSGTRRRTSACSPTINSIQWAGDHVIFSVDACPNDEWDRCYSVALAGPIDGGADAAHDDRRHHRGRDVGRALEGRQDALLHHQRRRHRSPPHLGRADRGRHAAAGHDRRRHRDVPDAARVRQAASRCSPPMRGGRSRSA